MINLIAYFISHICMAIVFVAIGLCGPAALLGWLTGWYPFISPLVIAVCIAIIVGGPGLLATFVWDATR